MTGIASTTVGTKKLIRLQGYKPNIWSHGFPGYIWNASFIRFDDPYPHVWDRVGVQSSLLILSAQPQPWSIELSSRVNSPRIYTPQFFAPSSLDLGFDSIERAGLGILGRLFILDVCMCQEEADDGHRQEGFFRFGGRDH